MDGIKRLLEINLQHASGGNVFSIVSPCHILANENIIDDFATFHESSLALVDKVWKDPLKPGAQ